MEEASPCCKKRWNWKAAVLTECEECRLSFWPTKKPSIIQQEMVNLKCYHELICKESRRESSFNKWKKHSQTPWGTVDLKHNGRSSLWGFPSMCLSPNSKPFGPFKVSRWSIWDQFIGPKQALSGASGERFSSFSMSNEMDRPSQLGLLDGPTNTIGDSRHWTNG